MAFFPDQVMPKSLKRESEKEVDNSPLIYNARDYNIHHREIRAIQAMLIGIAATNSGSLGSGPATVGGTDDATSGGGSGEGGESIAGTVSRVIEILDLFLNRGNIGQFTGSVEAGGQVRIPSDLVSTQTVGNVTTSATSIPVTSTAGFPPSGTITKFNRIDTFEMCSDGTVPGGGSRCSLGSQKVIGYASAAHVTNQEVITYTSKTGTSFNGCTRSVNGSTAQQATTTAPALVLLGRAAISFSHMFWGRGTSGSPNQFHLAHDALLRTRASLQARGSRTRQGKVLEDHIEISWLLTVVGHFESINVDQLFNAIG